ncbi:MAG: ketoacyl-ACP synthase III [Phycisphaeraceae bacterium]|nr:ketoacyl-ACP synthase III [Phycisphaeraceae bacterium]MCW5754124.1 ketoacyl-ACP synthase III [Phycisphaeraceae bacterium]
MTLRPTLEPPRVGARLAGTGSATPSRVLTNADFEKMMDTSDEWIVQRTGIHTRRIIDKSADENALTLATQALTAALADARMTGSDLDLLILATISMEMHCPPTACQLIAAVGGQNCGAYDLSAACCSFVFAMNTAWGLIRSGMYRNVAVVGADTISTFMDYDSRGRSTAILFGDAAGAVIMRATDDTSKGLIAQTMHSDGNRWVDLYIPEKMSHFPEGVEPNPEALHRVQMNGKGVFKFAVSTFPDVIAQTLDAADLKPDEVDHYICHQSNARILEAARERFGLPKEKLYVNIDRYGNTVSASVPLCFDELRRAGRVHEGQRVMFVAFGGGLTWGTSLWQL